MSINFKQFQFELFPGTQGTQAQINKPRFFSANLTLSVENLMVVSIVILMLIVLSFSLGVERGKRVIIARYQEYQAKIAQNINIIIPSEKNSVGQTTGGAMKPVKGANKSTPVDSDIKKLSPASNSTVASVPGKPIHQPFTVENSPTIHTDKKDKKALQAAPAIVYSSPNQSTYKPYTIQVASFKREEYANKEASLLKQKGYEIFVLSKGEHSIVCVGKFLLAKEAENFSAKLKKQYKDCLVRRF